MQWIDRIGRRLKFRDLHILLAVAEAGSMNKAARALAMSQPSVSKAIADLEHAVGARLLDRNPQGIEPTVYGRAMLKYGVAVFDDLNQCVKELEFLKDPTVGELRLGCSEPLAAGFVSAVIEGIARQHRGIDFHVVPANSEALRREHLPHRNIELAVALVPIPNEEPDLDVHVLFDDRYIVVAGAQSPWARRRKVSLAELLLEPWILPPPDSAVGQSISEAFHTQGCKVPRARVVSFSIPMHHHVLAAAGFLAVLPASMLHLGPHLGLRKVPVDLWRNSRQVAVIALKNRALSPIAQLFIDGAHAVAKTLTRPTRH